MTKKLFIVCAALVWTVALVAQNISVVAANGSTKLYRTLQAAIEGADPNSVIYLPGGSFPIADEVKITKKLTIIGIGYKSNNDNVDGITKISGNIFFNQGSDGSALIGCYVTGNINIAETNVNYAVDDILVKKCNVQRVYVYDKDCIGILINQNYIRSIAEFGNSGPTITNNVLYTIGKISGGTITHNIVTNHYYLHVIEASNSLISNNVFFSNIGGASNNGFCNGGENTGSDNMYQYAYNNYAQFDNRIILDEGVSWNDVFDSNYHFTDNYKQYENICGIYAGTGFDDSATPPVPYIVAKKIDEQTDAAGKLNIKIRVKASGEE